MTPPREAAGVIAEFADYGGLVAALRAAHTLRNIPLDVMDALAGAPEGYFSKVLSPNGSRQLTMNSLGWALGALGCKCVLVDDPAALKQILSHSKYRNRHLEKVQRNGAVHLLLSRKFLAKIGAKGGANSRRNLGKRKTKALARYAALARWR
jgi:hypothetical protein